MRWSVEQRLMFAAQRLYWDGTLNREDLIRRFGISTNQASADLAQLRQRYPEEVRYDARGKHYRGSPEFMPKEADPLSLLTELRLIAEGQLSADESVLADIPPLDIARAPTRGVAPDVLRTVLGAIHEQSEMIAGYHSFNRPELTERSLSPHALVFDGVRWYARAFDAGDATFKDFVLARLVSPRLGEDAAQPADADEDWNSYVDLVIAPHPSLTPHQQSVIALDYGMDDDLRLKLRVRRAIAFYTRRRLGLTEGHRDRQAEEQQIVLLEERPVA